MALTYNEITPQDPFLVVITNPIDLYYISYMIDLYQPIIGVESTNLYFTFFNQIPIGKIGFSKQSIHRQLISQTNLSFPTILKARKTLEAIGLLKSKKYKHKETDDTLYEYILIPPLNPIRYFQSDILSILLLNRLGRSQFILLQEKYKTDLDWNQGLYAKEAEITKSFDEVFTNVLSSELKSINDSEFEQLLNPYHNYQNEFGQNDNIKIKHQYLDIEFIKGMASNIYQLDKVLDQKLINLLQELSFLYQLTDMDIISILKDHTIYNRSGEIEEELLRKRMRDRYQYEKKEVNIVNKDEASFATNKQPDNTIVDKAQRHRWILENYSPVQLIEEYQGGAKVPDADLALIEGLTRDYKLPPSVVNVLIEYVMLTNEYKLPKQLTEKIAGHWKRLSITNVEVALSAAKKEHKLYKEWKESNKKATNGKSATKKAKTSINERKEKIPDYILQQEQKYHKDKNNTEGQEIDDETKEEIDQLLKQLGEV